jgi:Flp pilus assembly pilin Flp
MSVAVRFLKETDGADLVEYALLAAVLALGSVAYVPVFVQPVVRIFTRLVTLLGLPPH